MLRIARSTRGALITTGLLGGYLIWLTGVWAGWWAAPESTEPVTEGVLISLALWAAFVAFGAARAGPLPRAGRLIWRFVAVAQLCTAVVSIGWLLPVYGVTEFRLVGRIAAIVGNVLLLTAFVVFPGGRRDAAGRTAFWYDCATVACGTSVLAWHLLLRSHLEASHAGWGEIVHALLYPVFDVVIFFAAVTALLRRPIRAMTAPLGLLAASALLTMTADVLVTSVQPSDASAVELACAALYALVEWLVVMAAWTQTRLGARRTDDAGEAAPRPMREMFALPYVAIAAVFAELLIEAWRVDAGRVGATVGRSPLPWLALGAAAVTAIVVARQIAVQRHNAALVVERLARDAHFRALVQHSSDAVLVLDARGIVHEASPALERLSGYEPGAVVGRRLAAFAADGHGVAIREALDRVTRAGSPVAPVVFEWQLRHAVGGVRWIEAVCSNLLDAPAVRGIVLNARDVSERKALEAELTHRAFHDPLTGLVNRSRFRAMVSAALARRAAALEPSDEQRREGVAVLYIDLDDFKPVNDVHGHAAGDAVLVSVAERLREATRGTDTIARLGGDEFAVLLERMRDTESDARIVAERILQGIRRPFVFGDVLVRIDASIGIACVAEGVGAVSTPDQMLHEADRAMYAAKSRGSGCYEIASLAA